MEWRRNQYADIPFYMPYKKRPSEFRRYSQTHLAGVEWYFRDQAGVVRCRDSPGSRELPHLPVLSSLSRIVIQAFPRGSLVSSSVKFVAHFVERLRATLTRGRLGPCSSKSEPHPCAPGILDRAKCRDLSNVSMSTVLALLRLDPTRDNFLIHHTSSTPWLEFSLALWWPFTSIQLDCS